MLQCLLSVALYRLFFIILGIEEHVTLATAQVSDKDALKEAGVMFSSDEGDSVNGSHNRACIVNV